MPERAPFERLSETTVFDGSLISVAAVELRGPDGDRFQREIVHHPGAVVVVPVTSDQRAIMVRQYRAAVEAELLEVPAGKRDVDGEPTEVTARRELVEEVGRRAGRLDLLARFYNSPGFSDEFTWLYLARQLDEVPHDRQGAEEMAMAVEEVALSDVAGLISSGAIQDAKSIIGLCLAQQFLQSERSQT